MELSTLFKMPMLKNWLPFVGNYRTFLLGPAARQLQQSLQICA